MRTDSLNQKKMLRSFPSISPLKQNSPIFQTYGFYFCLMGNSQLSETAYCSIVYNTEKFSYCVMVSFLVFNYRCVDYFSWASRNAMRIDSITFSLTQFYYLTLNACMNSVPLPKSLLSSVVSKRLFSCSNVSCTVG